MKKVKQLNKKGFFKTKFIQFCRLLGYEIIDQNSFEVPTLSKNLNEKFTKRKTRTFVSKTGKCPKKAPKKVPKKGAKIAYHLHQWEYSSSKRPQMHTPTGSSPKNAV